VARGSARDVFASSGGGLMVVVAVSEARRCSGAAAVWRWGDGGATSFVAGRQGRRERATRDERKGSGQRRENPSQRGRC
jgi:hypothetical protein